MLVKTCSFGSLSSLGSLDLLSQLQLGLGLLGNLLPQVLLAGIQQSHQIVGSLLVVLVALAIHLTFSIFFVNAVASFWQLSQLGPVVEV